MSVFSQELAERNRKGRMDGRRWVFVPYDQLTDAAGPLSRERPQDLGIVLVENLWKAARRPYHKQKLAIVLANLRHFALEQADRGVAVRHIVTQGSYRAALEPLIPELGPLRVMTPAERELRVDLKPLLDSKVLEFIPHEGWLTRAEQFTSNGKKGPPWRMDGFYRKARRATGILMDKDKPQGGRFSFDSENRLSWPGDPPAPEPPSFPRDPIKEEVGQLIQKAFAHHPGRLDLDALPGTTRDAEKLWSWAKSKCLEHFGPFEDAMSTRSTGLFHTRLSALMNIHRILPARVISEVEKARLPMASKEGFIRQVLGWREFVFQVHKATDGFRKIPGKGIAVSDFPGDGGYGQWAGKTWKSRRVKGDPDGGARPSALDSGAPLTPAFWGEKSGFACLDHVVREVWNEAYSHHITRLMVLSNLATLLDVEPRELTDWFWVAYADAYDWVVEPNVLGMGTFSLGTLMTTKPYVSGAAYIHRMSDFCGICEFDPKKNCPITPLYWAFLARHRETLSDNPRLKMPMSSLRKRGVSRLKSDHALFLSVQKRLLAGEQIRPKDLAEITN